MSKPTAPVITYEYDVRNIPVFVENDDDEEEVPEQEEELNPRGNQKLLTRNRLVHDIDSALDQIITIQFIISREMDTGKLLLDI